MEKGYILLDVGGTEIKCGVSDEKGRIVGELCSYPSCAKEDKEVIFHNFTHILEEQIKRLEGAFLSGIGFAFPGPFDYKNGISLMKGLNKYDSIYGISIELELKRRIPILQNVPFRFLHDVEAFAIGAYYFGQARHEKKVFCLCIGTGAGSAFLENGNPLKEESGEVPKDGWIYCTPYKESIIDDYLSVRGLARISQEVLGQKKSGKELADLVASGDPKANEVWRQFGLELKEAITPFLERFAPDAMIMGGQITKSFSFFGTELKEECEKRKIRIYEESETSIKTMQGLFVVCLEGSI